MKYDKIESSLYIENRKRFTNQLKNGDLSDTMILNDNAKIVVDLAGDIETGNKIIEELSKTSNNIKNILLENDQFKKLILEIEKNSSLFKSTKKNDEEIRELLNDLILDLKEMNHLKKIKFLEAKVVENLDESTYSELIELKRQLNRD